MADKEIVRSVFKRMMNEAAADPEYLEDKAAELTNQIPEGAFSPARIQVYLLDHINEIDAAVAGVEEWIIKMRLQDTELAERKDQVMSTLVTSPRPISSKGMYVNTSFGSSNIRRRAFAYGGIFSGSPFAYGQPTSHSGGRQQIICPNFDTEGSMYSESVLEEHGYKSEEESGSGPDSKWESESEAGSANDSEGEVLEAAKKSLKKYCERDKIIRT